METRSDAKSVVTPAFFCTSNRLVRRSTSDQITEVRKMITAYFREVDKEMEVLHHLCLNQGDLALLLCVDDYVRFREQVFYKLIASQHYDVLRRVIIFLSKQERAHLFNVVFVYVFGKELRESCVKQAFQLLVELIKVEPSLKTGLQQIAGLYDSHPERRAHLLTYFLKPFIPFLSRTQLLIFFPLLKKAKSSLNNAEYGAFLKVMPVIQEVPFLSREELEQWGFYFPCYAIKPVITKEKVEFCLALIRGRQDSKSLGDEISYLGHAVKGGYAEIIFAGLLSCIGSKDGNLLHAIFNLFLNTFEYASPEIQVKVKNAFIDLLGDQTRSGSIPVKLEMVVELIPKIKADFDFFQRIIVKYQYALLTWGKPNLFIAELSCLTEQELKYRKWYQFKNELMNEVPLVDPLKEIICAYRFKL